MIDRVYHLDELVLSLPGGYVDHSIQMLEWAVGDGAKVALIIERSALKEGDDLLGHVTARTSEYPRRLSAYCPEAAPDIEIEAPHVGLRFRWRHEGEVLYHAQVFIRVFDRVVGFTASGLARFRNEVDAVFVRAVQSVRVREA